MGLNNLENKTNITLVNNTLKHYCITQYIIFIRIYTYTFFIYIYFFVISITEILKIMILL